MPPTLEDQKRIEIARSILARRSAQTASGRPEPDPEKSMVGDAQARIADAAAKLEFYQWGKQPESKEYTLQYVMENPPPDSPMPFGREVLKLKAPETQLNKYNEIRNKYGLGPAESLPEPIGVGKQIKEEATPENLPLIGGGFTGARVWSAISAAERAEEGKATPEDWQTLADFMEQAELDARERTFGGSVARIIGGSLPFMADMLLSGGLVAGGKAALKKAGVKFVKEAAEEAVEKGVKKGVLSGALRKTASEVARMAGETALRLPVFSHRIAAGTVSRMVPQFATILPEGPEGEVEFVVLDKGEGGLEAAKNALVDTYIEVFSELTGKLVGLVGLPKGKIKLPKGFKPIRIGARRLLAEATEKLGPLGFHGPVTEVGEERVAELLRELATRMGALDRPQQVPPAKQVLEELTSFFIMPAGTAAATKAGQFAADKLVKQRPTTELAKRFADLYPEEAGRIAAIEGPVSRKKLQEAAGTALTAEQIARMRRGPFRDLIRKAIEERNAEGQQLPPAAQAMTPENVVQYVDLHPDAAREIVNAAEAGEEMTHERITELSKGTLKPEHIADLDPFMVPFYLDTVLQAREEQMRKVSPERLEQEQRKRINGEAEAQPVIEPPRDVLDVEEIPKFKRKGKNVVTATAHRLITPGEVLPKDTFESLRASRFWFMRQLREIHDLNEDFRAGLKEVYGKPEHAPPQIRLIVNGVLTGRRKLAELPEPIREPVRAMRQKVDEFSRVLIDEGVVAEPIRAIIGKNMGVWLHRQYRAFIDPKWSKSVPLEIRNQFKNWLREEYLDIERDRIAAAYKKMGVELTPQQIEANARQRALTDNQLEQKMDAILFAAKEAGSPIGFLASKRVGSRELSILKKRKNLPRILRLFLGEVEDPEFNFITSAQKQAQLIASHRFLTQVRAQGVGRFLFEESDPKIDPEATAKIAADHTEVLWPLNGLYTYPEIKDAFERAIRPENIGVLHRAWLKLIAGPKVAVTVLSEKTQMRNFTSWWLVLVNTGLLWRARKGTLADSVRDVAADFRKMTPKQQREEVYRAIELGVLHEGATAGELRRVLDDASKGDISHFIDVMRDETRPRHEKAAKTLWRGTKGTIKEPLNLAVKLYQSGDKLPRYLGWKLEQQRYGERLPELSKRELEELAADVLKDEAMDYSMVPELMQKLGRDLPFAPFTNFVYEAFRTYFNNLRRINREFRDPKLRPIAAERLVGAVATAISLEGLSALSRMIFGVPRDKETALRTFMPEYSKNNQFFHLPTSDDGLTYTVVDVTYGDPYQNLRGPLMTFLRNVNEEDWLKRTGRAFAALFRPFIAEELLVTRALDVARNTTQYGTQVWNPQDSTANIALSIVGHFLDAYVPASFKDLENIYKGIKGRIEPWGQKRDPKHELFSLLGMRPVSMNIPSRFERMAERFNRQWSEAGRIVTIYSRSKGTVDDQTIRDKYQSMLESRKRLFGTMTRIIRDATTLGMAEEQIRMILDSSGIKGRLADNLFTGEFDEDHFLKTEVMRLTAKDFDDTSVRFFKAMGLRRADLADILRDAWLDKGYSLLDRRTFRKNRALLLRERWLYKRYPEESEE